ncbi:MAG: PA2169 family four-helix-bundle protein [Chloroflexi bacterium]|nr:PA2169 family four-helix-bundle protein [Chloroflexota bacterium]
MRNESHSVETILKRLNDICRDSEHTYRTAVESTSNPSLVTWFKSIAQQRGDFADDLSAALEQFGTDTDSTGTVAAPLNREKMKLAQSGGSDDAIVAEIIQTEAATLSAYENALNGDLPPQVQQLVKQQHYEIKEAYDHISNTDMIMR